MMRGKSLNKVLALTLAIFMVISMLPVTALANGDDNTAPNVKEGVTNPAESTVVIDTPYTIDLGGIFEDADHDTLTYTVSMDGNEAVNAEENYSCIRTEAGIVTLAFKASDGYETSEVYSVNLTVEESGYENTAPKIKDGVNSFNMAQVVVGEPYTVDLGNIFEDADHDTLTYTVSMDGDEAVNAEENYSCIRTEAGIVALAFKASDGYETSEVYSVNLTVEESGYENTAPKIKDGVNSFNVAQVVVGELYTVDLGNIFEDADHDTLTYTVSMDGDEAVNAEANYSCIRTEAGIVTLAFKASDGHETSDSYSVKLTVKDKGDENSAPKIKDGINNYITVQVSVGTPFTVVFGDIFEDDDDDPLIYTINNNGTTITADEQYSCTFTEAGMAMLSFTASDGDKFSDAYVVMVLIHELDGVYTESIDIMTEIEGVLVPVDVVRMGNSYTVVNQFHNKGEKVYNIKYYFSCIIDGHGYSIDSQIDNALEANSYAEKKYEWSPPKMGNCELFASAVDYSNFKSIKFEVLASLEDINQIILSIDELSDTVTLDDKEGIMAIRQAYNELPEADQQLIDNINKLITAEEKVSQLEIDYVDGLISALPELEALTYADKAAVEAARKAYDALSGEQQGEVSNYSKLTAVEAKLEEIKAAGVDGLINDLPSPEDARISDKVEALAAYAAYNELSDSQKNDVTGLQKLLSVLSKIAQLESSALKAETVNSAIEALPAAADLTLDDQDAVLEAEKLYISLSDNEKELVSSENADKLMNALAKIEALNAALPEQKYINLTIEKLTIGQGFVSEPVQVEIEDGENLASVITSFLGVGNYTNTGTVESSFYLSSIKDGGDTETNIPQYILDAINRVGGQTTGRSSEDYLAEFDYYDMSGWMYSINNGFTNYGMTDCIPENEDVIRLQFTVFGYGADLGKGDEALISVADKDALITKLAEINASDDKAFMLTDTEYKGYYEEALLVLQDMQTTQSQVDAALVNLNTTPSYNTDLGTVTVTVQDIVDRKWTTWNSWGGATTVEELTGLDEYQEPFGILFEDVEVTITPGMTVRDAIAQALESQGYFVYGTPTNITEIGPVTSEDDTRTVSSLSKLDCEERSKWVMSQNNWCIYDTTQDYDVEDGDVLILEYSVDGGIDIHCHPGSGDDLTVYFGIDGEIYDVTGNTGYYPVPSGTKEVMVTAERHLKYAGRDIDRYLVIELEAGGISVKNKPAVFQITDGQVITAAIDNRFESPNTSNGRIYSYTIDIKRTPVEMDELISQIPAIDDIIYADKDQVDKARRFYEYLSEEEKQQVQNLSVLESAEVRIQEIYDINKLAADVVTELIEELPNPSQVEITLEDEEQIRAAQAAYDALTDDQKVLCGWYSDKLANVVAALEELLDVPIENIPRDYTKDFLLSTMAINLTVGEEEEMVMFDTPRVGDDDEAFNRDDLILDISGEDGVIEIEKRAETKDDGEELTCYYVKGLSEGLAYFTVTYDGYTGQVPKIPVYVSSSDAGPDLTTDIGDQLTKYDTMYFNFEQGSYTFNFKAETEEGAALSALVNDTSYYPDKNGKFTIPLGDKYNAIIVTAEKDGQTTSIAYGVRAKAVSYKITNETRGGDTYYQGDTISIEFVGLMVPVPKVSRIYNPASVRFCYTTDMPRSNIIRSSSSQYKAGFFTFELTGYGEIELTDGCIDLSWFGSELYAETPTGAAPPNVGADQIGKTFSELPEIELNVIENPGYKPENVLSVIAEGGSSVNPGDTVTITIPHIDIEMLREKHTTTSGDIVDLLDSHTTFATDFPGLDTIKSLHAETTNDLENLKTITFIVPKDTEPGEYHIKGGYVWVKYGPEWWTREKEYYVTKVEDLILTVEGASNPNPSTPYSATQSYILDNVQNPTVGSVGGEWAVIGLARAESDVPEAYYSNYYNQVETYVKTTMEEKGTLHSTKSTDYSRLIIALTAIGRDVTDVGGYNLLEGLSSLDYVKKQGINGPVWALIAFDSHDYEIPAVDSGTQVTRENLIEYILSEENSEGGWSLSGPSQPDVTGMTLQALAPYYNTNSSVKNAVDNALTWLSENQNETGGYASWGITNCESIAQVMVALTSLGINPAQDSRFIKNGLTTIDALLEHYEDGGGFKHISNGTVNQMATEQAFYALVSYYRLTNNKTNLYDMTDVTITNGGGNENTITVTFDANGGIVEGHSDISKNYDKTKDLGTAFPTPEKEGFTFQGWFNGQKRYNSVTSDLPAVLSLTASWKSSEASEPTGETISVRFRLIGATLSTGDIDLGDDDYKGSEYVTWIKTKKYKLNKDATVYDLFVKALDNAGLSYDGAEKNYVESIDAPDVCGGYELAEYTNGTYSGWMYTVNGSHPNRGLKDWTLEDNDSVVWHYVNDFRYEVADWIDNDSAYPSLGDGTYYSLWLKATDVNPKYNSDTGTNDKDSTDTQDKNSAKITPKTKVTNGSAKAIVTSDQVEKILESVKEKGTNNIKIKAETDEDISGITASIPKNSVLNMKSAGLTLSVETPKGNLTFDNKALDTISSVDSEGTVNIEINTVDVSAMPEKTRKELDGAIIFELNVTVGDADVSNFGGTVTGSLPYTLKDGESPYDIVIVHVADDGTITKLDTIYDKDTGMAVFTTEHFSYYAVLADDISGYADISKDAWYYEAVKYVVYKGLMNGTGTTTFGPNHSMTRAMLVTTLYRLEGEPFVAAENSFNDVAAGQWYTDAIIWASTNGIISGYGNGLFGTNDNITRQQIATILYNYADYKDYDIESASDLTVYTDSGEISDWAVDTMKWANAEALITGRTEDTLVPKGTATRSEVATMIMRFIENIIK